MKYRDPSPHPSGAKPPALPAEAVPRHVAVIMDGNGRWAKSRGLPRTAGHTAGEHALFEIVEGALELGVHGITANCVAPGEIATKMTGQEDENPRRTHRPGVPLGRPGDAARRDAA